LPSTSHKIKTITITIPISSTVFTAGTGGFCILSSARKPNPLPARALPLALSDLVAGLTSCEKAGLRLVQDVAPPFLQPMTRGLSKSHVGSLARNNIQGQKRQRLYLVPLRLAKY
jgi:hypothetical protein